MEFPDDSRSDNWWQRYEQILANKEGVRRKLQRNDLPPEKRVTLEWQLQCVERGLARHLGRHPQLF